MSTIGPDTRLNLTGLDRLGGQALDDPRRQSGTASGEGVHGPHGLPVAAADAGHAPATDAGEDVLVAAAWAGIGEGGRLLAGDSAFEAELGAMPLSDAADRAADAILGALA
jgi:hypothetical protein